MPGRDDTAGPEGRTIVPAAFYRDTPPPTPPRDDPHWVEFPPADTSDSLPNWLLWAVPTILLAVMVLHVVLAIALALLLQHS